MNLVNLYDIHSRLRELAMSLTAQSFSEESVLSAVFHISSLLSRTKINEQMLCRVLDDQGISDEEKARRIFGIGTV